jgi:hypothetical protein
MNAGDIQADADIPCGRANDIRLLSPGHVRFCMPADGNYMGYWCVRLQARTRGACHVEVLPDPGYTGRYLDGVPLSYLARIGSGIFISRRGEWTRVPANGQFHPREGLSAFWPPDRIELVVQLDPGETVILS